MSLMFEVAEGGFLDIDVRIEGKNLATPSPKEAAVGWRLPQET